MDTIVTRSRFSGLFAAGLTESCCGSFLAIPNVMSMMGTVGIPVPNIEARLVSVPEMNYDALGTPERGEVCMKGVAVFSGYYKNEAMTNDTLVDGWLHTGMKLFFPINFSLKLLVDISPMVKPGRF